MEKIEVQEETLNQKITIITMFTSVILGLYYGLHYVPALLKMLQ